MTLTEDYAEEWWEWNWAGDWEQQMEDYGWAALPTLHDVPLDAFRMALLVEQRWKPPRWKGDVPSRLWDAATPSVGYA